MDYRGNIGDRLAGRLYGISRRGWYNPPNIGRCRYIGNLQTSDRQKGLIAMSLPAQADNDYDE